MIHESAKESESQLADSALSFASGYILALADHNLISDEECLNLRDELVTAFGGSSLKKSIERAKAAGLE